MRLPEIKNCPKCNAPFECNTGTISECKCSTLQLTTAQKKHIETTFKDCLCYNCLVNIQQDDHDKK